MRLQIEATDVLHVHSFDVPVPYVNAIRRTVLSSVSGWAFDVVTVDVNQSLYSSSFLEHMVSMLPCNGPLQGRLEIKHTDAETRTITSSDIQWLQGNPVDVFAEVPLFDVKQGDHISIQMESHQGLPSDHTRYQAGFASHRIVPNIVVPDLEDMAYQQLQKKCPRNVFQDDRKLAEDQCSYCGQCEPIASVVPSMHVVLTVRGNMVPARTLLEQSCVVLREQLRSGLTSLPDQFERDEVLPDTWCYVMTCPSAMTLCQLLVHELSNQSTVTFQACKVVHPLQKKVMLKWRCADPQSSLKAAFMGALQHVQWWLKQIRQ